MSAATCSGGPTTPENISAVRLQYEAEDEHPTISSRRQDVITRNPMLLISATDRQRSTCMNAETSGDTTTFPYNMVKISGDLCFGCGGYIFDRYLLQVGDQIWHEDCLRCCVCGLALEQLPSCYVRDDRIHCKTCYQRHFGVKCARCSRTIQSTDWVRRARQFVYHLACFACDSCKRQLSTGEEFALQESSVLCKQHYMELLDGDSGKAHTKQKTKRVRTTFSEEQLRILQDNFQVDSNPDGQDLERIALATGLSKRVTQVWFQNSRARQKKYQGVKSKGQSSGPQSLTCGSHENSMELECDEDDCDDMERTSSPQLQQSSSSSLLAPNRGASLQIQSSPQGMDEAALSVNESNLACIVAARQLAYVFESHNNFQN